MIMQSRLRINSPTEGIRTGYRRSFPNRLGVAATENERHAQKEAKVGVEKEELAYEQEKTAGQQNE